MIQITSDQYQVLTTLALRSARSEEEKRYVEKYIRSLDEDNNIMRDNLRVRWQDPNQPLPPGTDFPRSWPPALDGSLEQLGRSIAKADVVRYVNGKSSGAINIMVTRDPAGIVGWTQLDIYFGEG